MRRRGKAADAARSPPPRGSARPPTRTCSATAACRSSCTTNWSPSASTTPKTTKPIGVLVQWNNHPERSTRKNTEITADFSYYVVKHVRESQKCPVAYFTGTVGGLMTSLHLPVKDAGGKELADGTSRSPSATGNSSANWPDKALTAAVARDPDAVRHSTANDPGAGGQQALPAGMAVRHAQPHHVRLGRQPDTEGVHATKDIAKPVAVKTEVGYLKLGDLEVAVIPGEIYPELVLGKVQDPADPGADFPTRPSNRPLRPTQGQAPDDRRLATTSSVTSSRSGSGTRSRRSATGSRRPSMARRTASARTPRRSSARHSGIGSEEVRI